MPATLVFVFQIIHYARNRASQFVPGIVGRGAGKKEWLVVINRLLLHTTMYPIIQASTSTPTGDECDAAEVSPFASHTGPIKSGPPAGSQDRTDRNTTEGGSEGLSNGASQTGLVPQTSVPKRGSVARQVSWHDFHGKNLVEVREFEPR